MMNTRGIPLKPEKGQCSLYLIFNIFLKALMNEFDFSKNKKYDLERKREDEYF